ncbi:MAG: UvrD-helicase domain-containing protein [Deltaproteobacteria bacterium]|nr:UvrD-helicase domain-containing protein [Deltaproteobacteria bacterium]
MIALAERDATIAELLRFETNLVLRAGAGSGKTQALTSLAVRLLRGDDDRPPIAPERLVALTFTEKAAAEMRARIARGLDDDDEAAERIERAQVTTIHAFAAALLRAHAFEAGVAPDFTVLEDAASRRLARRAAARAISTAIRASSAARDLVDDARRTWATGRHVPPGLGDLVVAALLSLPELAVTPNDLLRRSPYATERAESEWVTAARRLGLRPSDAEEGTVEPALDRLVAEHVRAIETDERSKPAMRAAAIERCRELGHAWRSRTRLDARRRLAGLATEIGAALRPHLRQAPWLVALRDRALLLALLPIAAQRAHAFVDLVTGAATLYQAEKDSRHALDFGDLLVRSHALLRDRTDVRRDVGAKHDVLLVDEAQDTSPVQRDLLRLLHEDPERPGALRPSGLLLVGDRKQSIYGFRGADVGVLDELTRDVVTSGGRELPLRECFRSVPELVSLTNAIARAALVAADPAAPEPFEVVFEPALDALVAVREPVAGPCAELLRAPTPPADAAAARTAEARLVAHRVRELVESGEARFGDVALLLPRMTYLGRYVDALDAFDVPYVVEGGRGLLETEECRDVLALATVLSGDLDAIALAAVLRSPFVTLSDVALASLVIERGQLPRFSALAASTDAWPGLTAAEHLRLARFVDAATRAARDLDRIGMGRALRDVVDATAYDAVLAAQPDGPGRVANLDLLVESAARHEGDPRAWARLQRDRIAAGETEREADLATEGMDVVHVMTVHQSKGREHPVVVVADCARAHAEPPRFVTWDPVLGFAVRVPLPTGGTWLGAAADAVVERVRKRESSERARLLYVAATRARDRLVFAGESPRPRPDTWLALLGDRIDLLKSPRSHES